MMLTLSAKTEKRLLGSIKDALEGDAKQFTQFKAGRNSTEVVFGRAKWILSAVGATDWAQKYVGQVYLGRNYMEYGKPDAGKYADTQIFGYLRIDHGKMVIKTYDIGSESKTFFAETIKLADLQLDEDSIHIVLGPAIW